jgi:molecular chaperone Hsp33
MDARGGLADASVPRLLGAGYIAFTVDQGADMDRYQGIVALEGATLADCAHNYFRESEQIESAIRLTAAPVTLSDGSTVWRAGAVMLQRLPEGDPGMMARGAEPERDDVSEEDWRRAVVLLASVRDDELLDPLLDPDQLLFRLFHEDGVRVYDHVPLRDGCPCSETRARNMLGQLPPSELVDLADDDQLVVTCEFCNESYPFALSEFVQKV